MSPFHFPEGYASIDLNLLIRFDLSDPDKRKIDINAVDAYISV
jgi:hypothetical protein